MTTESLPVSFSPYINVTLDGMHLMVQDSADVDTDPEGVPLATVVTITPLVTAGTVILSGNHGYFPSKMTWLVCPVGWTPPVNSSISSLTRVEYPFSENIVNLADPDVITDADSYQIDLTMYDTRSTPPEQVGTAAGTLICSESPSGPVSLLSTIPVSASAPTSAIVIGPANTLSIGTVTTSDPGTDASVTITGNSPNQVLNLVIPRGSSGTSGMVVGDVQLEVNRGTSNTTNLASSSFITYPFNNVATNIGGGVFNTTTSIYTIPVSGLYLCFGSVRIKDSSPARSVGIGIGIENTDAPYFYWGSIGGTGPDSRGMRQYSRLARFNVGDQVRLYIYSDGSVFPIDGNGSTIAGGQYMFVVRIAD